MVQASSKKENAVWIKVAFIVMDAWPLFIQMELDNLAMIVDHQHLGMVKMCLMDHLMVEMIIAMQKINSILVSSPRHVDFAKFFNPR